MHLKNSYKQIWQIAYPLMLGSVALNVVNVINTAFLGRVSDAALGAAAIGGVLYFAFVMVGMGIGVGTQIITAKKSGEEKLSEIGPVNDSSLLIFLALSLIFFILLKNITPLVLAKMLKSPQVLSETLNLLEYRAYGILFSLWNISFRSFYSGIAKTKIITGGILVLAISNILLDYIMIFGNFGFPEMGIRGAGLASTLSEGFCLVYYLGFSFAKMRKTYNLFSFDKKIFKNSVEIIQLSLPMVFQYTISLSAWFLFFVIIEQLGQQQLALSNILRSLYMLLMTPVWGYSSATTTLVSNFIGQGNSDQVSAVAKKVITISFLSSLIMVLINTLFPEQLMELFTNQPDLIQSAKGSLNIISLALLIFSCTVIFLSTVSGTGDTKAALIIEVFSISLYLVYLYETAVVHKGTLELIWGSEILYWSFLGLLSFLRLKTQKRHQLGY